MEFAITSRVYNSWRSLKMTSNAQVHTTRATREIKAVTTGKTRIDTARIRSKDAFSVGPSKRKVAQITSDMI